MLGLILTAIVPIIANDNGVVNGVGQEVAEPTSSVSLMFDSTGSIAAAFSDIAGHWGEQTILWGVANNITQGFPDGTFRPNASVTEAQFLAMLLRAYGKVVDDTDTVSKLKYEIYPFPACYTFDSFVCQFVYAGTKLFRYLIKR